VPLDPSGSSPTLTCFVIGPIGNRHAPIGSLGRITYEQGVQIMAEVIEPACEAVGLQAVRADSLTRAGEITEQICWRRRDDDVVIADLTGANPNVMYELGLRHTQNKLTVQIGEYGQLPFDVNTIRTIQFSRSDHGLIQARDELLRVLQSGLADDFDPVTATRIWTEDETVDEGPRPLPETPEPGAEPNDIEPEGFLDVLAAAEEAVETLTSALEEVSRLMGRVGVLAEEATVETQKSDTAGKGMRGRLQVLTRYASRLAGVVDDLEPAVDRYLSLYTSATKGMDVLVRGMENDPEELAAGTEYGMILRRMAETSRATIASNAGFAESINDNTKISRVLRAPSGRLVRQLDRLTASTQQIDEIDRRLQRLGIPIPPEDWEPAYTQGEVDDVDGATD
jgi:hypothetical protein